MQEFITIARTAIEMMPPQERFSEADRDLITANQSVLLPMGEDIVQSFYNTLFAHGPTAAVFHEGERPAREQTLRDFWQRTITGELDEQYFAWMALVGLVHVVRGVENPMMIAMAHHIASYVEEHQPNAELSAAFTRLMETVSAVVVSGFDHAKAKALNEIVGMEPALLLRLSKQEAATMLERARR